MAQHPNSIVMYGVYIPDGQQLTEEVINELETLVQVFNLELDVSNDDERNPYSVCIGVYANANKNEDQEMPVYAMDIEDIIELKKEFDEAYTPEVIALIVDILVENGDFDPLEISMHLTNNKHLLSIGYLTD